MIVILRSTSFDYSSSHSLNFYSFKSLFTLSIPTTIYPQSILFSFSRLSQLQSQQSTIVLSHSSYLLCLMFTYIQIHVFTCSHITTLFAISHSNECGFSLINNSKIHIAHSNQQMVPLNYSSSVTLISK